MDKVYLLIDVAYLPDDDLFVVAELIHQLRLKRQTKTDSAPRPTVASIRAQARQLRAQLDDLPRDQIAARFMEVVDEIRAEAVAKGVAIREEPENG